MGNFFRSIARQKLHPDSRADALTRHSDFAVNKQSLFLMEDLLVLLHDLVYIIAVVAFIFIFFLRIVCVHGASMQPTLQQGDRLILVNNLFYSKPQRGDIVVARIPGFSSEPVVKRVIAVEGDTLDIHFDEGTVIVNGQQLHEEYILEATRTDFADMGITYPVTIEEGAVFLMGDNRNYSEDSRSPQIGQVDRREILGKAVFLLFPGTNKGMNAFDYSRIGGLG